ncbi:unnamed protein product, partial [Coregonus sp. 'balchen']
GVLLIDPEYLKDRKVFVTLTCAFRYGREDLDVLGLSFRKDLYISTFQAFPAVTTEERKPLSRLQERLLKKLGQHVYPFNFTIPQNLPCSVTLQPGPEDTGKVQYAPEKPGPQPMVETTRSFLMSDRSLHLEASLDKELYYHGEPIMRQYADICLFSTAQYKCPVAQEEAEVKDVSNKEVLGILVSYRVKVKLVVSRGGDVSVELPFVLMHPKPTDQLISRPQSAIPETDAPVDTNLIEFETNNFSQDDDFVFEDFARLRLKGMKDDEDDHFC